MVSRRGVLVFGLSSLAVGGIGGGLLLKTLLENNQLNNNQEKFLQDFERKLGNFKASYSESPETFDVQQARSMFVTLEYIMTYGVPEDQAEVDQVIEQYTQKVTQKLTEIWNEIDTSGMSNEDIALEYLISLKKAFHSTMKNPERPYNSDFSSIFDAMTGEGFQCRSGTKTINYTLLGNTGDEDFESFVKSIGARLVEIHSNGHTFSGIVFADGRLVGVDSVIEGRGVSEFGTIEKLREENFPINIVDSRHAFANEPLGNDIIHPDFYYILKNVTTNLSEIDSAEKTGLIGSVEGRISEVTSKLSGSRSIGSSASFGRADVPSGNRPLGQQDIVDSNQYTRSGSISQSHYGQGNSNNSNLNIDTLQLTPDKKQQVKIFIAMMDPILDAWNQHLEIMNNQTQETEGSILLEHLSRYLEANDMEQKYVDTSEILEGIGVRYTSKSPHGIYNSIVHNFSVTR